MGSEGLNEEELREGGFDRYLLEVEKLSLCFKKEDGKEKALKEVSLKIKEGEILALVGESGCGKSVFCKTVLGFLPDRAEVEGGSIRLTGEEILPYEEKRMKEFRRTFFSLVMQNPAEALNPSIKSGKADRGGISGGGSRKRKKQEKSEGTPGGGACPDAAGGNPTAGGAVSSVPLSIIRRNVSAGWYSNCVGEKAPVASGG